MTACRSLDEVRANIDRLDRQLVALLTERAGFVAQAARFKSTVEAVVVPERIESIIGKVRGLAVGHGADAELMETIYRRMIDAFITFEAKTWNNLHQKIDSPKEN